MYIPFFYALISPSHIPQLSQTLSHIPQLSLSLISPPMYLFNPLLLLFLSLPFFYPYTNLTIHSLHVSPSPTSTPLPNTISLSSPAISPFKSLPSLLSLDNSTEAYTDSTGVDLEEFIKKTLNKNPKDRQMLYGLENDLTDFISDNGYFNDKYMCV